MYAGKPEPGPSCKSGSPEPLSSPVPSPTIQVEDGTQSGISEGGRWNSGPCPNSQTQALDFQSLLPTRVLVKTRATPTSLLLRQEPPFRSRTSPHMPWGGQGWASLATSVQPGVFQMKPKALAWPQPSPSLLLLSGCSSHSIQESPLVSRPLPTPWRTSQDSVPRAEFCRTDFPRPPPAVPMPPPAQMLSHPFPSSFSPSLGHRPPEGGTRGPRSSRPLRCPVPKRRLARHSLSVTCCHTEPGPAPLPPRCLGWGAVSGQDVGAGAPHPCWRGVHCVLNSLQ